MTTYHEEMKDIRTLFPRGIAGIIYDCDGVMIESRAANAAFYNKVLAILGLPPMTREQETYTIMATGWQALCHIVPPHLHDRIERIVSEDIVYDRDIVPLLTLQPGFRDFMEDMHVRGIPQAMDTNRTDGGFQAVLDFFSLPPYLDPVVTATSVEPKPSSEGAQKICSLWGVAPEDVLFIGDSSHDREAARGAGTVFAAFGSDGLEGDVEALNYAELRRTLTPLWK